MIHVIATLSLKPGVRDEFLKIFTKLTPVVQAEEGCIEYGAAIDEPTGMDVQQMAGSDAVIVVEKWESVSALEAHLAAPHMEAFRQETAEMSAGVSLLALKPA
ncbi:putative quinol monooxygenase YgiN [Posidoniimonas polymericola]|uniref:Putative quinol monooxygenase YgiN n=1 Tax=Posidoniimonas polymericola TaxID=2528002 RepID=A0A5C5YCX4_9BACT|nr:putative quinol monooxygenase [Posidoniimonas polymericola]TWT72798.1 putative quinol monooxygenase YgiN [Posidoniimonas polymericola]